MTVHGGDGRRVALALGLDPVAVLDLSASLNPVAPDVTATIDLDALRTYPDVTAATAALAAALGVDADRVLVTNGGAEAIALVAGDLECGRVDEPDFALYRRHLRAVTTDGPRWRSDPHNPSGLLAGADERAAVWDEAFYPLATGRWTSGRADTGAVVLGSLTKVFACPGLRAGFVLADPATVARLAPRQPQWAVNGLVADALPRLLAGADLVAWAAAIASLRVALVELLGAHGLTAQPSDANYVLVPGARGLRAALAAQGVIVRDCTSFGLPDHVRIAVPDDAGRQRLAAALERRA